MMTSQQESIARQNRRLGVPSVSFMPFTPFMSLLARTLLPIAVAAPLLMAGSTAQASVLMGEPAQSTHNAATAEKSYSLAAVRKHGTATDCWSAVNGGVYNLTSWIAKHPGGASAILSICGRNGSAAFNRQHGGSAKVAAILKPYRIGRLR